MSKSYPKCTFYTCDIDDAPLAAYDAEVRGLGDLGLQLLYLGFLIHAVFASRFRVSGSRT